MGRCIRMALILNTLVLYVLNDGTNPTTQFKIVPVLNTWWGGT